MSKVVDRRSNHAYAHPVSGLQGSLLDLADEVVVHPLVGVRRRRLDHDAWVDVMPGWVGGADELYAALRQEVPWHAERRQMYDSIVDVPRLQCFYGEGDPLPHPALVECRDALSRHYARELGEPFVTAGLCLYRDGHDSVAWHGDRIGRSRSCRSARPATSCCGLAVAAPRCAWLPATGTCSSWVGRASAPGTTACRRRPGRSVRGSRSSSG